MERVNLIKSFYLENKFQSIIYLILLLILFIFFEVNNDPKAIRTISKTFKSLVRGVTSHLLQSFKSTFSPAWSNISLLHASKLEHVTWILIGNRCWRLTEPSQLCRHRQTHETLRVPWMWSTGPRAQSWLFVCSKHVMSFNWTNLTCDQALLT